MDHVLITGAGGLVGRAALEHFAKKGVRTTAVARRRPQELFGAEFRSIDLCDAKATEAGLHDIKDITQVVFAAVHEEPDVVAGWTSDRHVTLNDAMLRNTIDVVDAACPTLRNVVFLQGPKAYGVHVKAMPPSAREDVHEAREVPNFYWAQEQYIRAKQVGRPWGWTVFRPSLVVGMSANSALNVIAAIGVYAAVLKRQGKPLIFPGGVGGLLEATDTDLMAQAFAWASATPEAHNQTFNVTNGELFTLRDQWPAIAAALGMEVGPELPTVLGDFIPQHAGVWEAIVEEHGLLSGNFDTFIGGSAQLADFVFEPLSTQERQPWSISGIKLRQAGFNESMYIEDMFRKWFKRYQDERLLPPV